MHYKRTYYKHKEDGCYASLSDELVGIEAHDKVDLSLRAKCLEGAIHQPYGKSGKQVSTALEVSGQTVMNGSVGWVLCHNSVSGKSTANS